MPGDPNDPNPVKLKKPFKLNIECLWYVRSEMFRYIEMFMDHLDFGLLPWEIDDPETPGKKAPMYVQDLNMLRKMYKLKNIYEKMKHQSTQQPNPNNWNFGSPPPQLMKKKG
jgi:hypothetical protein